MSLRRGRYSGYIRPIAYGIDFCILLLLSYCFFNTINYFTYFIVYASFGWIVSTAIIGYYEIYRFTTTTKVALIAIKQLLFFTLIIFSFFGFVQTSTIESQSILNFIIYLFVSSLTIKMIIYIALKTYRLKGGSYRNTVIIGHNKSTEALENVFKNNPIYGYKYLGFFTNEEHSKKLGAISEAISYIKKNNVDDVYCSMSELSNDELSELTEFSNENFKTLKFIPDSNAILSSGFEIDYYDYFPVLKLNESEVSKPINRALKRIFDVLFSLIILVFVLSWLVPILMILIRLESKGSAIFAHQRNGLDYKSFKCYKFRSFKSNNDTDDQVTKKDDRITTIGRFIRKTSIDELPQFYNVLKGDMSVVGPRPHMQEYNKSYAKQVNNMQFLARHSVKPGITGLAQIRGYRGEIITEQDIIGRIKHDVFYIKNWSILLDLKIIVQTIVNLFRGEDKAY